MFTSLAFYGELTAAIIVFYCLPGKWRVAGLLALSCAFYLSLAPHWFWLLATQALIGYFTGLALAKTRPDTTRRLILIAGLLPIVGTLVLLKIGVAAHGILLPLGISYYTFKLVSYIMEVYWDEEAAEARLVPFATYVAFGAQMVSGPIQRAGDFLPQLTAIRAGTFDRARFDDGLASIVHGLMLKLLIGDRLAAFIATVDENPGLYHRHILFVLAACYTLQLYADFNGYTKIAIGVGRLFGLESPQNFNAPFAARNIQEFWRRWHISLSSWTADYIFAPLRMSSRDFGQAGLILSLSTSMIIIGLWHGLTLTFLVFGLLHATYMSVSALTLPARQRLLAPHRWLAPVRAVFGMAIVFILMTISQLFWQAHSMDVALLHLRLLSGFAAAGSLDMSDIRTDVAEPVFVCMAVALYHGLGAPGWAALTRPIDAAVPRWVLGGVALLVLSALSTESGGSFIYGQF
jgi:D-alanyl-lipoteichoic acid acyltransferase DltB (MBOAT superfamily)